MFECVGQALAERGLKTRQFCDLKTPRGPGGGFERLAYRFIGKSDALNVMVNSGLELGGRIMPQAMLPVKALDAIIDISGFAYSAQWGEYPMRALLDLIGRLESDVPVILLPQAFGPFKNDDQRRLMIRILERATRVYVRDAQSWSYLAEIAPELLERKAKLSGDFTALLKVTSSGVRNDRLAWVVPNYRMMDQTGEKAAYLDFLRMAIAELGAAGWQASILIHEQEVDMRVVEAIGLNTGTVRCVAAENATHAKQLIGQAGLVVGSRFHALVSALSQGVPAVGVGWSHKYAELFADYESSELLLHSVRDHRRLKEQLAALADRASHASISTRLAVAGERARSQSRAMWTDVTNTLKQRSAVSP